MDSIFQQRLIKIEQSLDEALKASFSPEWKKDSFGILPAAADEKYIRELIAPCRNLVDLGGKRWRPLLLVLCAESAKETKTGTPLTDSQIYSLAPLVEFAHTASLIHDDIEDCADMRRGKPAAHITYGIDTALNAASWLYFEAPVCIQKLPVSDSTKLLLNNVFLNQLRRLHLGQAMDISWHRTPDIFPSKEEYFAMTKCKTGTLAALAAETGILAGGGTPEQALKAAETAAEIGIGFQILDDVQNLTTGNPGKKRGDDIVEGKKSLPVLLSCDASPANKKKLASLFTQARKEGINSPAVEECISLLEKNGAIEKAAVQGRVLIKQKSIELAELFTPGKMTEAGRLIISLFNGMIPEAV